MGVKTILSAHQQRFLDVLAQEKFFFKNFYLTGGTALAEFHLLHRLSEDLDFFAEEEFDVRGILAYLKKNQKNVGFKKTTYEQSFNRNLFFLEFPDEILKTEFTFFPFPRIDKKVHHGKLAVDSLLDIAVNKLFTIYQKPRARDYIDLFCILEKTGWTIRELTKLAKIKFDSHIDPLQLGAQFLQAKIIKDYPKMIRKIKKFKWQTFFLEEAKKLGKNIFSS